MSTKEDYEKPVWPAIVVDVDRDDMDFIDCGEHWHGDADLCDAGVWGKSAYLVDSEFHKFGILHKVVRKRWFLEEVTNLIVPMNELLSARETTEMVRTFMIRHGVSAESYDAAVLGVPDQQLVAAIVQFATRD